MNIVEARINGSAALINLGDKTYFPLPLGAMVHETAGGDLLVQSASGNHLEPTWLPLPSEQPLKIALLPRR